MLRIRFLAVLVCAAIVVVFVQPALAESPNELSPTGAKDQRGENLKTLNGHFPFDVPETKEAWESRKEKLRRRVLVATGLWPMPEKTPLNPVVHGKIQREGFTVEKVYFESLPGHFVTGLLFRPTNKTAPRLPAVLSPHGHGGRLQRHSDQELARQLASGAEHFEKSGRMPKLARCAQLARMGCVTFIFDMLGYADSMQISHQVAHRYAKVADQLASKSSDDGWGFYSVQADLRLQSIMQLQTWNAIRSLDFLASLPDVDPDRVAVTGGSGGGTQTILLGAIDDRVKVGFPNGMVSTSMQGGCYCENCNLLRIDTGNVELAALFAPKPQAMTAADDWTRDMMTDGYPELRRIYEVTGNRQDVYCRPMLHFKHNYNYVTRATMYQWMNRHLKLGLDNPVIEQDYEPLTDEEMAVWNDDYPAPKETGFVHQQRVCRWFDQQAEEKLASIEPPSRNSLEQFRSQYGDAWLVMFDQGMPEAVEFKRSAEMLIGEIEIESGVLSVADHDTGLPILTARPTGESDRRVVIWSDEVGKAAGFSEDGIPNATLTQLVKSGTTVILPDLFHQGDLRVPGIDADRQPLIDDDRPYSAFTFGYNRTAVAHRAADLLAVIKHAINQQSDSIGLLATGKAALWAAPAVLHANQHIDRLAIDSPEVRFADVNSHADVTFVPGAVKYGDLPALLALRAPRALTMLSAIGPSRLTASAYAASQQHEPLSWVKNARKTEAILQWSKNE